MRLRIIYTVLIYLFCLTSCNQSVHRFPEFSHAEALMDKRPYSARALLLGLKKNINKENRATRMYYDLLLTKADDKCYIPHTSDSIMLQVTDYYKHHGKPTQKMEAYYLLGRVYSDIQYTGEAISFFRKVLNTACNNSVDSYIILARANNQIGHTYMYQDMYKEALPFFYKCYQFATMAKDTCIVIYALRDIGRSYLAQNLIRKGLIYFNYAASIALKTRQEHLYKMVISELSSFYCDNKEYDKAKNALTAAKGFTDIQNLVLYYNNLANYYQNINQKDSAIYLYKKCIGSENLYVAQGAAYSLANIYSQRNDYKQAYHFSLECLRYTDSLNKAEIIKNKSLINTLNKKLEVEKENNILQKEKSIQYLIIVTIFGILILSIIITYYYVRNKKALYKEQEERLNRALSTLRQNSRQEIIENSKRIAELEKQLSSSRQENNELQYQIIQSEKESLEKKNSQIEAEQAKQKLLRKRLEQSEIFMQFHQMTKKGHRASDEEFQQLEKLLNETYNNFTHRLYEIYPSMSQKEMRACELIKIGLSPTEMSCILSSSNSGISMIRQRLCQKVFHITGKSNFFDESINNL